MNKKPPQMRWFFFYRDMSSINLFETLANKMIGFTLKF